MRKLLTITAMAVALGLVTATAHATTILAVTDASYVGSISPDTTPNPSNEIDYINFLISLTPGDVVLKDDGDGDDINDYERSLNTFAPGGLPQASGVPSIPKNEDEVNTVVAPSAFSYILAKYDNEKAGALVWFLSGVAGETYEVPLTFPGTTQEVSHVSFYSADLGDEDVPDGGATIGLLGLAMLGVGYVRRRFA
jgi:hypothetical protein